MTRLMLFISVLLWSHVALGAVTATTVWEWRQTATASEANGCGYDSATSAGTGTDWTQQNTAQYSLTGLTSAGAGNVILTASASNDMLGNVIHITAGTNFTLTHPWFLITAVSPGVSLTVSTNSAAAAVTIGVGSAGTGTIGGACNVGSATLDNNIWADFQPGNQVWFKNSGTAYVPAAIFAAGTAGTALLPVMVTGYNSTRGDSPTGANRPAINFNAFSWSLNTFYIVSNLIVTSSASQVMAPATDYLLNMKIVNNSVTAGRSGLLSSGQNFSVQNSEIISYRGSAINTNAMLLAFGNYIHSSAIGMTLAGSANYFIVNNIFADNYTGAILNSSAQVAYMFINGNTIYGGENKLGYGFNASNAAAFNFNVYNNIFYGLVNGIQLAGATLYNNGNYNSFFNNTTDVTNWTKGPNDIATTPSFINAKQVIGTAGIISGSTLTDAAANFANVVDNQDFVYIVSGTGATVGQYLITSHTSTVLTLNSAPGGTGTNIVYQVATGHNFIVGLNMKRKGWPGIYPGALTTGYLDIGAAQRYEYGKPVNKK